jgi:hypothetical protein
MHDATIVSDAAIGGCAFMAPPLSTTGRPTANTKMPL